MVDINYLNSKLNSLKIELQILERDSHEVSYVKKCNTLNDIISIKKLLVAKYSQKVNAYSETKKFLIYYIKQMDELEYEYDKISLTVINRKIDFFTTSERIHLLNFFFIQLKKYGYEKESEECKKLMDIEYLKFNSSFTNNLKLIGLFVSQNLFRLILSIIIFFILTCIIMSPAPFACMECLSIKYEQFSTLSFLNHILNVFSLFFDFDNGMKVTATGLLGVILIAFGKLIFVTILLNYFVRKILEKIKIVD